jgi:hemoglobin-like flavoprotein
MTPDQVALVQDSFKKVVPIAATAADLFYDRLFAIAPPVVPPGSAGAKTKLIAMLATVVVHLHQLEKMMAQVEQLGRRHVTYGVTADHYAPVGEALLWTLEQGLGAEFTSSVKAAWTEAYLALSGAMQFGRMCQSCALVVDKPGRARCDAICSVTCTRRILRDRLQTCHS